MHIFFNRKTIFLVIALLCGALNLLASLPTPAKAQSYRCLIEIKKGGAQLVPPTEYSNLAIPSLDTINDIEDFSVVFYAPAGVTSFLSPDQFKVRYRQQGNWRTGSNGLYRNNDTIVNQLGSIYEAEVRKVGGSDMQILLEESSSGTGATLCGPVTLSFSNLEACSEDMALEATTGNIKASFSYVNLSPSKSYALKMYDHTNNLFIDHPINSTTANESFSRSFNHSLIPGRQVRVVFVQTTFRVPDRIICENSVTIPGVDDEAIDGSSSKSHFNLCQQVSANDVEACNRCVQDGKNIWTSVGCIPTEGTSIVSSVITIALGMAGGIGLLMIIAAGAMFSLSRNDPKKVGDAKEMLGSVIIGLIFIVFSVTVLEFIGVTILRIPGFGGN